MGAHRYIGDIQFKVDSDNDLDIDGRYFQPEHGPEIVAFINEWLGVEPPAYTPEDVAALVAAANEVQKCIQREWKVYPSSTTANTLTDALEPFQADPDKELIEAMTVALFNQFHRSDGGNQVDRPDIPNGIFEVYVDGAKAALAVVKEKGLPQ